MSLQSLLSIARTALITHQRAMGVTAHNVANAETPGYSRQRLDMMAQPPMWGPFGTIGRGVTDMGITRAREGFFDAAFRRDSGLLGGSNTMSTFIGRIETAMNEPSDDGVSASLDQMFHAFSDLSGDPSSPALRDLVKNSADRFVGLFHRLDSDVKQTGTDALQRLQESVDTVNSLAKRIAELNAKILALGGPTHTAPDLEDARDVLVDQLSGMIATRVTKSDAGSYSITAGSTVLVDGGNAQTLDVRNNAGGPVSIGVVGDPASVTAGAGGIGALLDLINVKIPGLQAQLDNLARSLVTEINAIHQRGYTASGVTGTDFFNAAGVTAGTIALTPAIAASGANIAAGATPAPGDGNIALEISRLAGTNIASLGNLTFGGFYGSVATEVGIQSQNAAQDEATYDAMVSHDDAQRQSVSGVSVEEEMVNLISQQQAFSAAARIVKVADDMMQSVLDMI